MAFGENRGYFPAGEVPSLQFPIPPSCTYCTKGLCGLLKKCKSIKPILCASKLQQFKQHQTQGMHKCKFPPSHGKIYNLILSAILTETLSGPGKHWWPCDKEDAFNSLLGSRVRHERLKPVVALSDEHLA